MSEQLWSDERIIAVSEGLGAHFDRDSGDRPLWNQMARMIEKDMREMRDDFQQRIDALEAENERLHAQQTGEISELVKVNREAIDALHELFDLRAENAKLREELKDKAKGIRQLLVQRSEADADNERLRAMCKNSPDDV